MHVEQVTGLRNMVEAIIVYWLQKHAEQVTGFRNMLSKLLASETMILFLKWRPSLFTMFWVLVASLLLTAFIFCQLTEKRF